MASIDDYLHAATRDNKRKIYRASIEYFEASWEDFFPATADSLAWLSKSKPKHSARSAIAIDNIF